MTQIASDKKILVIEDDKSLRKAIVEKLTFNGFKTAGAEDGEKGMQLSLDWKPDLVVLDLLLPKMDGITVLKGLRANFGKELPVIILTNVEPDDKMISDVVEYQPSYYFVKSDTELDNLVSKIRGTLKLDQSQTGGSGSS